MNTQEAKTRTGRLVIESRAGRPFEKSCLYFVKQYHFYLHCSGMASVNMFLKTSSCGCSTTSLGKKRNG